MGQALTSVAVRDDVVDGQRRVEDALGLRAGDLALGFERVRVERDGRGAEPGDGCDVLHPRPSRALLLTSDEHWPDA